MFGFRPVLDLTVTRFYTAPQIHDAMRRMHESDVALREAIDRNPDLPVVFIQRDDRGRIIPCSPNKILLSNTTTLRPFNRILPIGFQTDYAVRVRRSLIKSTSCSRMSRRALATMNRLRSRWTLQSNCSASFSQRY